MKPTPALCVRLRFSTKDVGKGFYRGNRTGSMGAHTPKGGYLIDYRKVRSYKVPNLSNFKLMPYVTKEIGEMEQPETDYDWEQEYSETFGENLSASDISVARRKRALQYLNEWRQQNPSEYNTYVQHQVDTFLKPAIENFRNGQPEEILQRLKSAIEERRREDIAS